MNELRTKFAKEIEELAQASRRLGELGFVASHGGNLSFRVDDETVLITPTKRPKREILPDDIIVTNFSGEVLSALGGRKPTGETPLHLSVKHYFLNPLDYSPLDQKCESLERFLFNLRRSMV